MDAAVKRLEIIAAVMAALQAGIDVEFNASGQGKFMLSVLNRQTGKGVDVEAPIAALAYDDAFVKQYLQPALTQLRS